MRVLMIGERLPAMVQDQNVPHGGAELQQLELARRLSAGGWVVDVVGRGDPAGVTGWADEGRVFRVAHRFTSLRGLTGLAAAYRRSGPHVAMVLGATPFLVVYALLARFCGAGFVVGIQHDLDLPGEGFRHRGWRRRAYLLGLRLSQVVVVQHEGQKRRLLAVVDRPVRTIPNFKVVRPPRETAPLGESYLWLGTYRPQKRAELFLDLAERVPEARFTMVCQPLDPASPGPAFEALEARAHALPNVTFVPGCPHARVRDHLKDSRALVLTSDSEGWPNVVLESAALGRPILTMNDVAGGVVGSQRMGAVASTVTGLAEVIRDWEPERWRRAGTNAHAYVRSLGSNEATTELYRSAIRSATTGANAA